MSSSSLKFRLSLMMFLQYFIPGATVPILSHYLKNHLHFDPLHVGIILAMPPLAAIASLLAAAYVTDRYFIAERLLALCQLAAGGVMVVLAWQRTFGPFLALYLVYGLFFSPTFGLTNTVVFHHATDAKRDFGGIRMWGTAGWVVVGWAFSLLWLKGPGAGRLADALTLSAIASFVLGLYAFTLPRSMTAHPGGRRFDLRKSLAIFARPSLLILCVLTILNSVVHQFYYYGMSPFLSQVGLADSAIMPAMSLGQLSEVVVLGVLGVCLAKLGIKWAMIIGALTQALRYGVFAFGGPMPLILGTLLTHGVCYAFFFTAAYIYVDHHCKPEDRGSAQQVLTIMINGFGTLAGFYFSGVAGKFCTPAGTTDIDFHVFWLIPLVLGLAVAGALALFFKEEERE